MWLPQRLLRRSVSSRKLQKALRWSYPPARFTDKILRARLEFLSRGIAQHIIAFFCVILALMVPLMEMVPFSANAAGLILNAFGLALLARDGLMSLFALLLFAGTIGGIIYYVS